MVSTAKTRKTAVRAPRAEPAPSPRGSLVTALARQAQSFASSVLGNVGAATDVALTLAQSRIDRPGPKAAVEKGAALLRDLTATRMLTTLAIASARAARYPENAAYILRNVPAAAAGLRALAAAPPTALDLS